MCGVHSVFSSFIRCGEGVRSRPRLLNGIAGGGNISQSVSKEAMCLRGSGEGLREGAAMRLLGDIAANTKGCFDSESKTRCFIFVLTVTCLFSYTESIKTIIFISHVRND